MRIGAARGGSFASRERAIQRRRSTVWRSGCDTALVGAPVVCLPSRVAGSGFLPGGDFGAEPESGSASAAVEEGAGHLGVAALVEVDGGGVGESEELGDVVRVDEVVDVDPAAHNSTLGHPALAGSAPGR